MTYRYETRKEEKEAWAAAACLGKEAFETARQALDTIKRIEQRRKRSQYRGAHNQHVEAYQCRFCSSWHIGKGRST